MNEVFIAGIGQTPVGEHWDLTLSNLSSRAILAAIRDAGGICPQALYVGNFLASSLSQQANLGTLLADKSGLNHIETFTAEAGEASGAAALRMGYLAVKSGYVNAALVVGIEKYTDMVGAEVEGLAAQSTDYDFEATEGLTGAGQAGMLMARYLETCRAPRDAFAILPMLAHANGLNNPYALFRKTITLEAYSKAPAYAWPLNLFDAAPFADGAAAVLLVNESLAKPGEMARIAASSVVVDALALHDRPDPLAFSAAALSVQQVFSRSGLDWDAIDLFELWDAYSIFGVLTIEACGLAAHGEGWRWTQEKDLSPKGRLPLLTMGGNKARGFPFAAAGIYQAVEAVQQLRGAAGANQVQGARTALIQAMGGPASTVITHILKK